MNDRSLLFVVVLAALAGGCKTSSSAVRSEFDREVEFAKYETFIVADEAGEFNMVATDGYEVAVMQAALAPDLRDMAYDAIVEGLQKKGLRPAEAADEADLIVTYLVNVGAKPEVLAPDYRVDSWSTQAELGQAPVARGMLVLDILDPDLGPKQRSFLIWRGWVSDTIDPDARKPRGQTLTTALKRVIARYPK